MTGSVNRNYNSDFNLTELKVNGLDPVAFQYDNDQLLTQAGSLTLSRSAQNGLLTGTALGGLTDSYSYNGFGEVTGGSSNTFDYAYDVAERLVEVKQNGIVQSSYGYDSNGNRTDLNGVPIAHYDAQDRLLDYNNATYDYTANGELKTKTVGTAVTSYSYDVLGNLRHVNLPNGSAIDYVIDGQNRRIGKKRNNVLEQGFLYQDQLKPIAELDGSNQIVSRFVYATGANVPDFMIKGGATYRIIKDHLGSPRLVVDIATNTVIQQLDYDVWGKVIQDTNPGFQPFGFAGGLYDRDTGLVRFGARDYDAETGRWMAKDPIGLAGGINTYAYVYNNPVNLTDPKGLVPPLVIAAVGWVLENAVAINTVGIVAAEVAGGLPSPVNAEVSAASSVAKYEVGLFNNLKSKSLVGDGLDIHHVAQSCPATQAIPGYNRLTAPSIAIPQAEHRLIPTISGDYNGTARDLLAKDILDLRNYTNTPNSSLQELIQLNKQAYPNAFTK